MAFFRFMRVNKPQFTVLCLSLKGIMLELIFLFLLQEIDISSCLGQKWSYGNENMHIILKGKIFFQKEMIRNVLRVD